MNPSFADATLVLMGHGSTKNTDSKTSVLQHVVALQGRKLFAAVRPAFWKQEPFIQAELAALTTPRVFIVPMFISEGYFSEEVIPLELGFRHEGETNFNRTLVRNGQTLYYTGVIGTHPSLTQALLARAQAVMAQFPFPRPPKPAETTLYLAGHGTEQNKNSRVAIEQHATVLRSLNIFADVQAIFMEEAPRIQDCAQLAATRNIVVVPHFISDGLHVREDIPVLLGEPERIVQERLKLGQPTWRNPTEKHGKRIWYAPAVGTDPAVAEVILERVRAAATS